MSDTPKVMDEVRARAELHEYDLPNTPMTKELSEWMANDVRYKAPEELSRVQVGYINRALALAEICEHKLSAARAQLAERTADVERIQALHNGLMAEADKRYDELCAVARVADIVQRDATIARLQAELKLAVDGNTSLALSNARLREDAERWQWMRRYARYASDLNGIGFEVIVLPGEPTSSIDLNEAINTARRESSQSALETENK